VIPPLAVLFAVYVLVTVLRNQNKEREAAAAVEKPTPDEVDADVLSRLEDELHRRDN